MLRINITVDYYPQNMRRDSHTAAVGSITNDGSGSLEVASYDFEFIDDFGKVASGHIEGYTRGNQVWKLVYLCLKKVFEGDT